MKNCHSETAGWTVGGAYFGDGRRGHRLPNMLTTTLFLIWKLLLPLLVVVAVIDWLTASDDRRIRILRRTGLSQLKIATRLNITRHRVRRALAS